MILERYCDYDTKVMDKKDLCPVIKHGSQHLHTECRACQYNIFEFTDTLKVIRSKMSDIDPIFTGTYPKFDESYMKKGRMSDVFKY